MKILIFFKNVKIILAICILRPPRTLMILFSFAIQVHLHYTTQTICLAPAARQLLHKVHFVNSNANRHHFKNPQKTVWEQ